MTMDRDSQAVAEEILDEVLSTPPTTSTYACECGDPNCIFATETGGER